MQFKGSLTVDESFVDKCRNFTWRHAEIIIKLPLMIVSLYIINSQVLKVVLKRRRCMQDKSQ